MGDYRIDELARAAGTTVRNVRVYQDRGLLPPPRREGRVGIYSDAHLARLRLIGQLLDRGYTFNHIAEFIEAWQRGRDLSQLLGLEEALTGPWSDEIPDYVDVDALRQLFGEIGPDLLDRAVRLGLLVAEDDRFRVPSPRLLHAGAELVAAGIPLADVLDLDEALLGDLDRIAHRLVELVGTHLTPDPGSEPTDEEVARLAALVRRLRPLAQMSVQAHLARAMEQQVRAVLGERLAAIAEARLTDAS